MDTAMSLINPRTTTSSCVTIPNYASVVTWFIFQRQGNGNIILYPNTSVLQCLQYCCMISAHLSVALTHICTPLGCLAKGYKHVTYANTQKWYEMFILCSNKLWNVINPADLLPRESLTFESTSAWRYTWSAY